MYKGLLFGGRLVIKDWVTWTDTIQLENAINHWLVMHKRDSR